MQLPTFLSQIGEFRPPVENEWTTGLTDNVTTLTKLETVISALLGLATTVGGLLFLYTFIQGALSWVTAGGDSGKIQKARDQMIQGAIGLIILVAAYAVIGLIGTIVGINILNPALMIGRVIPN